MNDQGLAITRCLLAGTKVFDPEFPEERRISEMVRGFHGFHAYANNHWVEYILAAIKNAPNMFQVSEFFRASCTLSQTLGHKDSVKSTSISQVINGSSNKELAQLQELDRGLFEVAQLTMIQRQNAVCQNSLTTPKSACELGQCSAVECQLTSYCLDDCLEEMESIRSLDVLMANYQKTITTVLKLRAFHDTTLQDLEKFKRTFRMTAFACRTRSCPHAVTGFDSIEDRDSHEITHRMIICEIQGCQYPPFRSANRLTQHQKDAHSITESSPKRSTIRRKTMSQHATLNERLVIDPRGQTLETAAHIALKRLSMDNQFRMLLNMTKTRANIAPETALSKLQDKLTLREQLEKSHAIVKHLEISMPQQMQSQGSKAHETAMTAAIGSFPPSSQSLSPTAVDKPGWLHKEQHYLATQITDLNLEVCEDCAGLHYMSPSDVQPGGHQKLSDGPTSSDETPRLLSISIGVFLDRMTDLNVLNSYISDCKTKLSEGRIDRRALALFIREIDNVLEISGFMLSQKKKKKDVGNS